jgi:hypothetical protein
MIELPEAIQPYLKPVIKYHFWLLAVVMPLVLVPLAFTADATLLNQIKSRQGEIKSKLDAADSAGSHVAPGLEEFGHPKEDWVDQTERATDKLRQVTLSQWKLFWDEQQPLREWPGELGEDFIRQANRLTPDAKLSPRLLERYQNTVRRLVRALPARIDAEEQMTESSEVFSGRSGRTPRGPTSPSETETDTHTVDWDATDQSELFASFNWTAIPSTTQVFLANEELHCYEELCDVVREANRESTGRHNAAISSIRQLAVGYRAAEENPGGLNGNRIQQHSATGGDEFGGMGMDMGMGIDGMAEGGRPMNPRFSNAGSFGMMPGDPGGFPGDPGSSELGFEDESETDELLKNWIYVDFEGKPLAAEDLEISPDAKLVHLVPFVLSGRVDQRKLDLLLQTFATRSVPFDVRQVRINPGSTTDMTGLDRGRSPSRGFAESDGSEKTIRRYDLDFEIRGTIALATKPDPVFLGFDDPSQETN